MGYEITVEQLVAALSGFRPALRVWFSTFHALGYGLNDITSDQGVCMIHTSSDGEPPTIGKLLGRFDGIPTAMGVMLCAEGIAEARAVSLPFEDEDGGVPCVCVTAF